MKRLIATLLVLAPVTAFAAPTVAATKGAPPDPAKVERMEKRMRTALTIGIANALDLDAAQALQLQAAMQPFDERRKAVHQQLKQSRELLERAADGDPAVSGQVDAAIQQAFEARGQMEQIDREMLTSISRNLNPQQKAKLAVFLASFKHEMMQRMGGKHGGWRGEQGARE